MRKEFRKPGTMEMILSFNQMHLSLKGFSFSLTAKLHSLMEVKQWPMEMEPFVHGMWQWMNEMLQWLKEMLRSVSGKRQWPAEMPPSCKEMLQSFNGSDQFIKVIICDYHKSPP